MSRAWTRLLMGLFTLGLLAAALWLLAREGEPSPAIVEPRVLTPRAEASDGGSVGAGPEPGATFLAPAAITLPAPLPLQPELPAPTPAAHPVPEHAFRGVAVRASDGSPVDSLTVIAVERGIVPSRETELARTRTGRDGSFSLRTWRAVDAFHGSFINSSAAGDRVSRPGDLKGYQEGPVPMHAEWLSGDPAGGELRLVVDTGWRLDLRLVDGAGNPRASVVVTTAGHTRKTNVDGRCTLLDLPASDAPLALTLGFGRGVESISLSVDPPETGRLVREATLTVP